MTRIIYVIMAAVLLLLYLSACSQRQRQGDDFFAAQRYEMAADLYVKSAEQGDTDKMMRLGEMYAAGKIGYKRDYENAVYWYKKAAEHGIVRAMFELGFIYEYGQGEVIQNDAEAEHWYKQAAAHNDAYSQYRLAEVMARQLDDYEGEAAIKAYRWFLIAERTAGDCKDNPLCRIVSDDKFNYRWELQRHLKPDQQSQALQLAKQWSAEETR